MSLQDPKHKVESLHLDEYDDGTLPIIVTLEGGKEVLEEYVFNPLHEGVGDQTASWDLWCELTEVITDPSQQYYLLRQLANCVASEPYVAGVGTESLVVTDPIPSVRSPISEPISKIANDMRTLINSLDKDITKYDALAKEAEKYIDEHNTDSAVVAIGAYVLAVYGKDTMEDALALLAHARKDDELDSSEANAIDSLYSKIDSGELFYGMPPQSLLFDDNDVNDHLKRDLESLLDTDDESNHRLNVEYIEKLLDENFNGHEYTTFNYICLAMLCRIAGDNCEDSQRENLDKAMEIITERGISSASKSNYDRDVKVFEYMKSL